MLINVLKPILPWADDVAGVVRDVLNIDQYFFSKTVAIILCDFYRFDSISTSVCEQAIVLSEMGFKVEIICNNISGMIENDFIMEHKEFDQNRYDLLLYHYYVGDPFLDVLLSVEIPKIVYYHGITTPPSVYFPYSPDFTDICKKGLARVGKLSSFDYILSNSKYNIEQIRDNSNEPFFPKYHVLPPIISVSRFEKRRSFINKKPVKLLSVGRIYSSKNLEGVIDFAHELQTLINRKLELIIVGSKCENSYLDYLVKKSKKNKQVILQVIIASTDNELKEIYERSEIFVNFSHHEGFCIPLIEAMASGLLIVTHSLTAIPETMGNSGVVVSPYAYSDAAKQVYSIFGREDEILSIINRQYDYYESSYRDKIIAREYVLSVNNCIREVFKLNY